MKQWGLRFWQDHGDRIIFMAIAAFLGINFIWSGVDELKGAGTTALIAVVTLAINKARSTPKQEEPKE